MISWILSAIAITGAITCVFKKPITWKIWLLGNFGWFIYCVSEDQYAQAVMWMVYIAVCIFGIVKWSGKETNS